MKIKVKLIAAFILISLIPLILVSVISTHKAQKALKESIKTNLSNLAKEKAAAISFIIEARIEEAELLASTPAVKFAAQEANIAYINMDADEIQGSITIVDKEWIGSKGETKKANSILNNVLSKNLINYQNSNREKYGEIFITDIKGATVAMTKTLSDYYQADEEWWKYVFYDKGDKFVDDRGFDASIGALAMGIVVPVKDNEKVIGILKINYKIKEILEIVSRNRIGETGFISLIRSQGEALADSRVISERELSDVEKKTLNEKEAGHTEDLHAGQKTIMGHAPIGTEIFTRVHSPGARKGIWGERWETTIWRLFIDVDQSESFAIINNLRYLVIIIVIIVISLVIGAALLISGSISVPIRALQKGTEIISGGNLDYKIEILAKNEIGQLADSFNTMTKDLQKTTVSRDYVDNIFRSMADILVVIDSDTMIRTVNQATVNLLGHSEDELRGKPFDMIIAKDEEELLRRPGIEDLIKKYFVSGIEKTYLSKTGEKIPVIFSCSVMQDDNGKIQGVVCVASDITQRKLLEESLASEKEHLSVTLYSIGDGVIATDDKGNVVMLNKVAEELTGWTQDEASGMELSEVFHIINPNTRKIAENPVDMVLEKKKTVELANNTTLIARDKTVRIIADSAAPIHDKDNNIIGVVLVFRDVSERKQLEDEKQNMQLKMMQSSKLASLGEIATGIAHEINQPLTYINSFVFRLQENLENGVIKKDVVIDELKTANNQIARITNIINHLRTFGRTDDMEKEQVNIETALNNTLLLMGERIRLRNIELKKNITPDLPMLPGNPNQLEQVFINLFQNAIDAFPSKPTNAELIVDMSLSNDKESVIIVVADNGIGVDQAIMDNIFDPFFTTKEVGKGTGVGLSIVYGIITEHNGSITCESDAGKGCAFTIMLPVSAKA